jgi:hypothetical protein
MVETRVDNFQEVNKSINSYLQALKNTKRKIDNSYNDFEDLKT